MSVLGLTWLLLCNFIILWEIVFVTMDQNKIILYQDDNEITRV